MIVYNDPQTGYEVRVLTKGPNNTKPYFDTEATTPDDARALVTECSKSGQKLWIVDVQSAHRDLLLELKDGDRFCAPLGAPHGWVYLGQTKTIHRVNLFTGDLEEVADASFCRTPTSGHTEFKNGLLAASYKHDRAYYILAVTDPQTGKSEIIHRTDQLTNHTQACPGDNESLLHINETGGDALQRMWMFNVREGIDRPYYVEKLNDWVTHECWTRSGDQVMFCNIKAGRGKTKNDPQIGHYSTDELDEIWYGARDGQAFRCVGKGNYLHAAPDVTERWIVADDDRTGTITLLDTKTGHNHLLLTGLKPRDGSEHCHPSFNREGDMVLFTMPRSGEGIQVGVFDLSQVSEWSAERSPG